MYKLFAVAVLASTTFAAGTCMEDVKAVCEADQARTEGDIVFTDGCVEEMFTDICEDFDRAVEDNGAGKMSDDDKTGFEEEFGLVWNTAADLCVALGDWVKGWPTYDVVVDRSECGDEEETVEGDEAGEGADVEGGEGEEGEEGEEGDNGLKLISSSAALFAIGAVMLQ